MGISKIVADYLRQNIQSEEEVRSKFIVPLLEELGYPIDYRAEEFPVYGSEGSKSLNAKAADFIQFTSNKFADYRTKTDSNLKWVYEHSLLVFEAKKPTESIAVKEQPIYYAAWTKAPAYMISNGKTIEGYITNANYIDSCIFSCSVAEIPQNWTDICKMDFINIQKIKGEAKEIDCLPDNDLYEKYMSSMNVRCAEELYYNVDRMLIEDALYNPELNKNERTVKFETLFSEKKVVITSEPGGGKSCLLWMLMRDFLNKRRLEHGKLPVLLAGKYYGKLFCSISEGVYKALKPFVRNITIESVEKQLYEGELVILFDALDEVESNIETLVYELVDLSRNTENIIFVTSRSQNYKGDFAEHFMHYKLEPLSDQKITEFMKKYSNDEISFNIYQIPRRLLELIRIPLFLQMFMKTAKCENGYKIPSNQAELFNLYVEERLKNLRCDLYTQELLKRILEEYAVYCFENGEATQEFMVLLEKNVPDINREKYFDFLWKAGFINGGEQGIKYFHKTFEEYFYAYKLSRINPNEMSTWLEKNASNKKYIEIICFLTGIISNQSQQNLVLDYLEEHNLRLYVRALKSRRNFYVPEEYLDNKYAEEYFSQIRNSYSKLIDSYFPALRTEFDGFRNPDKKICIKGSMNILEGGIELIIYGGDENLPEIEVDIAEGSGLKIISPTTEMEIPFFGYVFRTGVICRRSYNLRLLGYGFDSSREIALDIIKKQMQEVIKQKKVFDGMIPVLFCEQMEKVLKEFRRKIRLKSARINLSLYVNDIDIVINELEKHRSRFSDANVLIEACKYLKIMNFRVSDYLDVPQDLELDPTRHSYMYDELYSEKQLVKKIERIIVLEKEAINRITTKILPVLQIPERNTKLIGEIYRQEGYSCFRYIEVICNEDENTLPIIVYSGDISEETDEEDSILSTFLKEQLKLIGKTENDIRIKGSSILREFFGDDVFHKRIYEEIRNRIKNILG